MNNIIERIWKQGGLVNIEDLRGTAFQAEESAHTFRIRGVDESGEPLALTGTCAAIFLRADNTDVAITGTITDGAAEITLTDECYDMPGRFGLTIYVTSDEQTVAVYAAIGSVCRTSSGTVSPETGEDVMDLINAINDAIEDLEEAIARIPQDYQDIEDDVAALQSDVEDIQEDVGDLQEKTNDYAPVIVKDASGDIVRIDDGAGDMKLKTLEVEINPVQDLHGYDNPWPAGGGKNLLEITAETQTLNGVTFTINKDSAGNVISVTANGTNSDSYAADLVISEITLSAGSYYLSGCTGGGWQTYLLYFTSEQGSIVTNYDGSNLFTLTEEKELQIRIIVRSGVTVSNKVFYPMIRLSSVTDATFAPYENKSPISGWDSANVGVAEHYSPLRPDFVNEYTNNGVTFDVKNYPFIEVKGTAVGGTAYSGAIGATLASFKLPAGTHTLKAIGDISSVNIVVSFSSGSGISNVTLTANNPEVTFTFADEYGVGWYLNVQNGTTADAHFALVYEEGQAYEYPFPSSAGTVYGGTLTIHQDGSGELVVDRAYKEITSETYIYRNTDHAFYTPSSTSAKASGKIIADRFKSIESYSYDCIFINSGGDIRFNTLEAYSTGDAFKTAFIGTQIVYELATPVTYQLTNQQVLTLLKGNNVVFADCGAVSLEYPADTKLYIDGKIAEIQALILENISNS